jgi:hypothetical protein
MGLDELHLRVLATSLDNPKEKLNSQKGAPTPTLSMSSLLNPAPTQKNETKCRSCWEKGTRRTPHSLLICSVALGGSIDERSMAKVLLLGNVVRAPLSSRGDSHRAGRAWCVDHGVISALYVFVFIRIGSGC